MFWFGKKKKEKEAPFKEIDQILSPNPNTSADEITLIIEDLNEKGMDEEKTRIVDPSSDRKFEIIYQATEIHTDKTIAD